MGLGFWGFAVQDFKVEGFRVSDSGADGSRLYTGLGLVSATCSTNAEDKQLLALASSSKSLQASASNACSCCTQDSPAAAGCPAWDDWTPSFVTNSAEWILRKVLCSLQYQDPANLAALQWSCAALANAHTLDSPSLRCCTVNNVAVL